MTGNKWNLPHECTDITQVRNEIDRIDGQIIQLLAERFTYVREVVKYKENTPSSIEASDRRKAVIDTRRQWAAEAGLCPDIVGHIYDVLIDYFIQEEKKIMEETNTNTIKLDKHSKQYV